MWMGRPEDEWQECGIATTDLQPLAELGPQGGVLLDQAPVVQPASGPLGGVGVEVFGEGDPGQTLLEGLSTHFRRLGLRVEGVLAVHVLVVEAHTRCG